MVHHGPSSKLVWCEPVEARVGPLAVVVDPPIFDDLPRLSQVGEQRLVQEFVSEPTVKTFDEAVLLRFTR